METNLTPPEIRTRAAKALVTMDKLFARSGISPQTFRSWEKGIRQVTPLTMERLKQALEAIEQEKGK